VQIDIDPRHLGVTRPLGWGSWPTPAWRSRASPRGCARWARSRRGRSRSRTTARSTSRYASSWPRRSSSGPGRASIPADAIGAIGAFFGRDAIYTVDGGNTSLWAYAVLPSTRPRSYHSILELGMLGTGIPSAVGAKLGAPDRDVVCITGDGAAGFNVIELQSAAREGLAITVIVFAEGSWTMEEPNELSLYGRTFGCAQGEIRWDLVAEGLGAHGEYVDRIEDLDDALARAREHDGPTLICLRTDHDANLNVPHAMPTRFFEVYSGPRPVAAAAAGD